jgi:hypothetical protein
LEAQPTSFILQDTPTGIGSDSMEVGIMRQADFAAGGCDLNLAPPDDSFVGSDSNSGTVDPGTYTFIVGCANIVDPCLFNLTWTATY